MTTDTYDLSGEAWRIIKQAETRKRFAYIDERIRPGDDHVKLRKCGLNAAETQVVQELAKREKMVAVNFDIEDGEPWIALTTIDLATKIFPAEAINETVKAIFADAHTVKLVFDAKMTFRIFKLKEIELQNFVDVKELAEFTKLRTGLHIHRSLTVGTLCLHLFAWDYQAHCSEDEYVYSNRKLPYWWKKFPVERQLDQAYKGGMYNLVRLSMIHASSTLLLLYVEHVAEHDLRIQYIIPHRKDGLRDIVKRVVERFRTYVGVDNEFLKPFESKNSVAERRDLRERIRKKSNDRKKFIKFGKHNFDKVDDKEKEEEEVLVLQPTPKEYNELIYGKLPTLTEVEEIVSEEDHWGDQTGNDSSSEEEPVSKEPLPIKIPRRKIEPPKKLSKEERKDNRRKAKILRSRTRDELEVKAERVPKSKRSLTQAEIKERAIPTTKGLRFAKGAKPVSKSTEKVEDRFSVSFDDVCSFCGGRGKNFHVRERCSVYRRYKSGKVTRNLCLYPLCPDRKRHCTAVCFLLHERCEDCGGRGHYGYQCEHMGREYLRKMYELYRRYGIYSRKHSPKWNYRLH